MKNSIFKSFHFVSAIFIFLLAFSFAICAVTPRNCDKAFVFFDLGDTLIDTHTHDYNPMFLHQNTLEHLNLLKANGHPLGLITDVPESWGRDQTDVLKIKDYFTAKLKRLINFIDGHYPSDKSSWLGPKFNWAFFGSFEPRDQKNSLDNMRFNGRIILPLKTSERKRNGGTIMYQRARLLAAQMHCEAIYETADDKEIEPAYHAGLIPFWVGHEFPDSYFMPLDKIKAIVESRRH